MIRINKQASNEPPSWINYRRTPGVVYQASDDLRNSLLSKQGHLCVYCMRRIPTPDPATNETSHIEHVKCRKDYKNEELNYWNMVVCCPGNIDRTAHCDRSKDYDDISFDLFNIALQDSISYSAKDGNISSSNTAWNSEMNEILQLNNPLLKLNRINTLNGIIMSLKNVTKNWSKPLIENKLKLWSEFDRAGKLKPFCGIAIWYLKRKLKQL